jgi:hypothetical protein
MQHSLVDGWFTVVLLCVVGVDLSYLSRGCWFSGLLLIATRYLIQSARLFDDSPRDVLTVVQLHLMFGRGGEAAAKRPSRAFQGQTRVTPAVFASLSVRQTDGGCGLRGQRGALYRLRGAAGVVPPVRARWWQLVDM